MKVWLEDAFPFQGKGDFLVPAMNFPGWFVAAKDGVRQRSWIISLASKKADCDFMEH